MKNFTMIVLVLVLVLIQGCSVRTSKKFQRHGCWGGSYDAASIHRSQNRLLALENAGKELIKVFPGFQIPKPQAEIFETSCERCAMGLFARDLSGRAGGVEFEMQISMELLLREERRKINEELKVGWLDDLPPFVYEVGGNYPRFALLAKLSKELFGLTAK